MFDARKETDTTYRFSNPLVALESEFCYSSLKASF